ncbi:MAG TPA: DnaD domain protein [Lachnospiraceae bacterium]
MMSPIKLKSPYLGATTIISNNFIDYYMPQANGEFVKIYLYLIRTLNHNHKDFLLETAADTLACTESDIIRALLYWEKVGVLSLQRENNTILSIDFPLLKSTVKEDLREIASSPKENLMKGEAKEKKEPVSTTLTSSEIASLLEKEEIKQLLFIAEQYLGKTLSPSEAERILFFYEKLHFSFDLLEYLIEYCVSKGKKSIRYIESVAFAWHKDHISSVEMAKNSSSLYNSTYYSVFKALGIRNRDPIESEKKLIDTWIHTYAFTMDIIEEACRRTISQIGQPRLEYVDSILGKWHSKQVHNLSDIEKLDFLHKENQQKHKKADRESSTKTQTNHFNNFQQRNYDMGELEKQLLNR